MKDRLLRFLTAIDNALLPHSGGEQLLLYHIGRSALVWKHGFQAATQDVDVVRPREDRHRQLLLEALRLFGRGTPNAREYGLYLEEVCEGLPPVTGGCYKRAIEVEERWQVIRVFHLEDHDLAVTKLKRFSQKDQEDIRLMCDLDLLDSDTLKARVESAYPYRHDKDEDVGREAADANVKIVVNYLTTGEWR